MGAFRADRRIVAERLTEMVGYRAGLAIAETDILDCLQRRGYAHLYPPGETGVRMRSEAFEIMNRCVADSFVQPGALQAMRPIQYLLRDRLHDKELVWQALGFIDAVLEQVPPHQLESLDVLQERGAQLLVTSMEVHAHATRALLRDTARSLHGDVLADAVDLVFREEDFKNASDPWKRWVRTVEWNDVLDLADLFTSDSATASYGRFFDQRFVTYLASRYEDLAAIHWRKFEALVAEYFHRAGFEVELGPGRNDNGVDIRVWESGTAGGGQSPPLMIVQCKRERRKISKVVVKALAADVAWEHARTGMLVATVDWSPGAREVVRTRSYPVQEVNGEAVRSWLKAMQSSDTGLWLPQ
ncbi:restriction endonuclease [Streptomyces sp. NPDC048504]|uniref:restriction endonuclease n=1 Tax=Streptomyces sp. NPDC048504 TaxID=3365559 RepID=UPI003723615A